jgi:hypothetical protein
MISLTSLVVLLAPFLITDGSLKAELRVREGKTVAMKGLTPAKAGQPHGHLMKSVVINPRCCNGRGKCSNVIAFYDLKVSAGGAQTFFITKAEPGHGNLNLTFNVGVGKQSAMRKLCDQGPGTRTWPVTLAHRFQCRDTSALVGSGKSNIHKQQRNVSVQVVCEPPPRTRRERPARQPGVGVVRQPQEATPRARKTACRVDRECGEGQRCGRDHYCYRARR